jgi:hypothetical protein
MESEDPLPRRMLSSGMWRAVNKCEQLADYSTLKMEAISSSETSVYPCSTQRHIPEDDILHSHSCESLKSYIHYHVYKNPNEPSSYFHVIFLVLILRTTYVKVAKWSLLFSLTHQNIV